MDFSHIGFDVVWENETRTHLDARKAMIYGFIFVWFAFLLLVSIIRTISTSPGNIPDEKEWDMVTDITSEESQSLINTNPPKFTNG
jgi:hypothetical protein